MRHEAVVPGIAHRRVQEAVDDQGARRLVHLVLDRLAADRHFDDGVDVLGRVVADRDGIEIHGPPITKPAAPCEAAGLTSRLTLYFVMSVPLRSGFCLDWFPDADVPRFRHQEKGK